MFSEDPNEQELYHATATVTSLLLEMGEVGKLFCSPASKDGEEADDEDDDQVPVSGSKQQRDRRQQSVPPSGTIDAEINSCVTGSLLMEDIKLEDSSPKDTATSSAMLISDDETKDDTSVSSYSVLSAGSHELDDKLQCEDIAEDTVLIRNGGPQGRAGHHGKGGLPHSTSIDNDWTITFEQFLASVLTEHALVQYFEKPVDITARITNAKNVRKVGEPHTSVIDYEISLSG